MPSVGQRRKIYLILNFRRKNLKKSTKNHTKNTICFRIFQCEVEKNSEKTAKKQAFVYDMQGKNEFCQNSKQDFFNKKFK